MVNMRLGSMTEAQFKLRTARALASTFPDRATNFVADALARTVDPRLRHLIEPALVRVPAYLRLSLPRSVRTVFPVVLRARPLSLE